MIGGQKVQTTVKRLKAVVRETFTVENLNRQPVKHETLVPACFFRLLVEISRRSKLSMTPDTEILRSLGPRDLDWIDAYEPRFGMGAIVHSS